MLISYHPETESKSHNDNFRDNHQLEPTIAKLANTLACQHYYFQIVMALRYAWRSNDTRLGLRSSPAKKPHITHLQIIPSKVRSPLCLRVVVWLLGVHLTCFNLSLPGDRGNVAWSNKKYCFIATCTVHSVHTMDLL